MKTCTIHLLLNQLSLNLSHWFLLLLLLLFYIFASFPHCIDCTVLSIDSINAFWCAISTCGSNNWPLFYLSQFPPNNKQCQLLQWCEQWVSSTLLWINWHITTEAEIHGKWTRAICKQRNCNVNLNLSIDWHCNCKRNALFSRMTWLLVVFSTFFRIVHIVGVLWRRQGYSAQWITYTCTLYSLLRASHKTHTRPNTANTNHLFMQNKIRFGMNYCTSPEWHSHIHTSTICYDMINNRLYCPQCNSYKWKRQ